MNSIILFIIFLLLFLTSCFLFWKSEKVNGGHLALLWVASIIVAFLLSYSETVNEISVEFYGLSASLKNIKDTERRVYAAATTVTRLEAQTQRNKEDAEILYLKTRLTGLIQGATFGNLDTMNTGVEILMLLTHYEKGKTGDQIKKMLKKEKNTGGNLLSQEISNTIDMLEKSLERARK